MAARPRTYAGRCDHTRISRRHRSRRRGRRVIEPADGILLRTGASRCRRRRHFRTGLFRSQGASFDFVRDKIPRRVATAISSESPRRVLHQRDESRPTGHSANAEAAKEELVRSRKSMGGPGRLRRICPKTAPTPAAPSRISANLPIGSFRLLPSPTSSAPSWPRRCRRRPRPLGPMSTLVGGLDDVEVVLDDDHRICPLSTRPLITLQAS